MAVSDLGRFRKAIPEVFEDRHLPDGLEDYELVPVDVAEDPAGDPFDGSEGDGLSDALNRDRGVRLLDGTNFYGHPWFGGAGASPTHPGGIVGQWWGTPTPPTDALAFYLPFHFHHPTWWGIYLFKEGVEELQRLIRASSSGQVSATSAYRVARMFLYGHEQFHHMAECFTTRLEATQRVPLYRTGVWSQYKKTFGTSDCTEESLANAFGYQKAEKYGRENLSPVEWRGASDGLTKYIRTSPPGYAEGLHYLKKDRFEKHRRWMAEEYHNAAVPAIPRRNPDVWLTSPYAFRGIAQQTSRVNYLVRKNSSIAKRVALGSMPLRYREVARALLTLGCVPEGSGKGSHERWRCASGGHLAVPRHPGDMKQGTLKGIFEAAGRRMSFHEIREFVNSV